MENRRPKIPKQVREQVLKEFRHRCAICDGDRPQVHHIDEDASNNDPLNLIPLCPNCHLSDQHDPTVDADPSKLLLFRQYQDPAILKPQFHPLFTRLKFLDQITEDSDIRDLQKQAKNLIDFLGNLEMGLFYSQQIGELIQKPKYASITILGDPVSEARRRERLKKEAQEYREILKKNRNAVLSLAVELLRFQSWSNVEPK